MQSLNVSDELLKLHSIAFDCIQFLFPLSAETRSQEWTASRCIETKLNLMYFAAKFQFEQSVCLLKCAYIHKCVDEKPDFRLKWKEL